MGSPGGRRGSESSGSSRSRDRTSCVVPSPLAATCTLEDVESEFPGASAKPSCSSLGKERKDFSRLFVPIPPSPGAMDCCTTDGEESTPSSKHPLDVVPKVGASSDSSEGAAVAMDMEETGIASSQDHSMSVDSSHSPVDSTV